MILPRKKNTKCISSEHGAIDGVEVRSTVTLMKNCYIKV